MFLPSFFAVVFVGVIWHPGGVAETYSTPAKDLAECHRLELSWSVAVLEMADKADIMSAVPSCIYVSDGGKEI